MYFSKTCKKRIYMTPEHMSMVVRVIRLISFLAIIGRVTSSELLLGIGSACARLLAYPRACLHLCCCPYEFLLALVMLSLSDMPTVAWALMG